MKYFLTKKCSVSPAGVAEWIARLLHMCQVRGSRSSLGELALRIHYAQVTLSAGDSASTLYLKPICRVNQIPRRRAPVAPQNGETISKK